MAARQMVTMVRSGSQAAFSLGRALGITGRIISTDTSIIVSTIAKATTGRRPRAARLQRNTAQNFTARQCTTYTVRKLPANASN